MKVLITGVTGFIGKHLAAELLSSGYEVAGLVRRKEGLEELEEKGLEVMLGDVRDFASLLEVMKGMNAVVHLAAATSVDSTNYEKSFLVNVLGSQNVIDACRIAGVRKAIYLGTQADNPGAYATTKREAEKLFRESDLDWVIMKPSLVYGSGNKGLSARMVGFMKRFPFIPIVGTGRQLMCPIYVEDVVWTVESCLEKEVAKREYFISGPEPITYCRFMEEIGRALGLRRIKVYIPAFLLHLALRLSSLVLGKFLPITADTLKGLTNARVYANNLAEKELGFNPTPLREGLRRSFG